ncbi:MAG: hypothetical protein WA964_09670 [Ilumatobacter sp.]|uniref:hypothetical protein n=1 Tax=Ilumatobacter sp. TaxID=1967498 RepID=UPI003C746BCF
MIIDSLDIDAATFRSGTGWDIKPEGACKGEVCVPLGGGSSAGFDLTTTAERLGMAVVSDTDAGVHAVGPESFGGNALVTAVAPDVTLRDLDGNDVRLSDLHGRKVVLAAWSPY